jgi:hypothetical protein
MLVGLQENKMEYFYGFLAGMWIMFCWYNRGMLRKWLKKVLMNWLKNKSNEYKLIILLGITTIIGFIFIDVVIWIPNHNPLYLIGITPMFITWGIILVYIKRR